LRAADDLTKNATSIQGMSFEPLRPPNYSRRGSNSARQLVSNLVLRKAFSEALQRHGIVKRKGAKGVRIFEGVRLRPKPDIRQAKEARGEFG
jgi:hypothetical protein